MDSATQIDAFLKKEIGTDEDTQHAKQRIDVQSSFGCQSLSAVQRMINPLAAARSTYVYLDADQASDQFTDRWHWPIALQGTQDAQGRSIRVQALPSNIVAIHLSSVKIVFNEPLKTAMNINNRVGICVDECDVQSSEVGQSRLHFLVTPYHAHEFQTLELPDNSNLCAFGTYWFHPPILSMTSVTISLFDPIARIPNASVTELRMGLEIICFDDDQSRGD